MRPLLLALLVSGVPLVAQNTVGAVEALPRTAPVNVETVITATAIITSPSLIVDGANLQRVDAAGRVVTNYGPMRDDGKEGDAVAGDRKFTRQIKLKEATTGPVNLRVAAAFQGQLTRVFSGLMIVNIVGSTAPKISILTPPNLAYLNVTPTTVTGTVDIPTATVSVNGMVAPVTGGRFTVAVPLLEGPNVVAATASAPGAPSVTDSITVNLDTTPPRVTIVSPEESAITTDTSINVSGIVNDIVVGTVNELQVTVTVNGRPAEVANRTFLARDVPLTTGENTITATGRDRAGNTFTTSLKIRREAPPPPTEPTIRIVSGNNQSGAIGATAAQPLVVEVRQGATPLSGKKVIFKVLQNNALVGTPPAASFAATTDALGRASVPLTLGERSGAGGNRIEAYAVGVNGGVQFTATSLPSAASQIVVDTGNGQNGAVGQRLPKPFIAVVIDKGNNRLAGVPVTFTVKSGGGGFGGTDSVTLTSDSDGRVAAFLTLGLQEGRENNLVEANFPGNTGYPAVFTASGRLPADPAATRISGVVLDNSNVPLPGVTVKAVLTTDLSMSPVAAAAAASVVTDAQGQFAIQPAPVGFVKLVVDGSTTAKPGKYPTLDYDLVTVAGQTNTVGQPIYLLPLKEENRLCVTATSGGGKLEIAEAPGFSLSFGPGQVTFPGGSKEGCVSVTVVHTDKVPMVPGFGQQPRFIVTIQPAGAVFNPPAPITLPNVDGLKPNAVTEMYSFDHDIGSFVAIGTGEVSEDGLLIRSSKGVGVLKAGWHCGGNPSSSGAAAQCGPCAVCDGTTCRPDERRTGHTCDNPCLRFSQGRCDETGTCSGDKLPDGLVCDPFGSTCKDGQCLGGKCGSSCNSGNPCLRDSCVDGKCGDSIPDPTCGSLCFGKNVGDRCRISYLGGGGVSGYCGAHEHCDLCSSLPPGTPCYAGGSSLGRCSEGTCKGSGPECPAKCLGGACISGECGDGTCKRADGPCTDNRFCTSKDGINPGPDECTTGNRCLGVYLRDRPVTPSGTPITLGFSRTIGDPVGQRLAHRKILRSLTRIVRPTLGIRVGPSLVDVCCEEKSDFARNIALEVAITGGVTIEVEANLGDVFKHTDVKRQIQKHLTESAMESLLSMLESLTATLSESLEMTYTSNVGFDSCNSVPIFGSTAIELKGKPFTAEGAISVPFKQIKRIAGRIAVSETTCSADFRGFFDFPLLLALASDPVSLGNYLGYAVDALPRFRACTYGPVSGGLTIEFLDGSPSIDIPLDITPLEAKSVDFTFGK